MTGEEVSKELYRVKQSFINTHTDAQLKKPENKRTLEALDVAIKALENVVTISEIPKDYKYDTETKDFLVYRNMYTGDEIHIERPTPMYRLEQEPCEDVAKERYEDLCEYFGEAKVVLASREEFKKWLERVKWHVRKADELARELERRAEPCDDCVSRKSVIDVLTRNRVHFCDMVRITSELKELPSVTPKVEPCEDCISRATAIKAMNDLEEEDIERYGCSIPEGFDGKRAIEVLKKLPSVTPKPKTDVLDKIRAEINGLPSYVAKFNGGDFAIHIDKERVLQIIDKYKAESEDKE